MSLDRQCHCQHRQHPKWVCGSNSGLQTGSNITTWYIHCKTVGLQTDPLFSCSTESKWKVHVQPERRNLTHTVNSTASTSEHHSPTAVWKEETQFWTDYSFITHQISAETRLMSHWEDSLFLAPLHLPAGADAGQNNKLTICSDSTLQVSHVWKNDLTGCDSLKLWFLSFVSVTHLFSLFLLFQKSWNIV